MFEIGLNRPENLWKDFILEIKSEATSSRGRAVDTYDTAHPVHFTAILCGATPDEVMKSGQTEHPITHTVTHKGVPIAKAGDRFIHDDRAYIVQKVDNPGDLGLWTLYYCEERSGTHDGNGLV